MTAAGSAAAGGGKMSAETRRTERRQCFITERASKQRPD